jgi:hypothetical protein
VCEHFASGACLTGNICIARSDHVGFRDSQCGPEYDRVRRGLLNSNAAFAFAAFTFSTSAFTLATGAFAFTAICSGVRWCACGCCRFAGISSADRVFTLLASLSGFT